MSMWISSREEWAMHLYIAHHGYTDIIGGIRYRDQKKTFDQPGVIYAPASFMQVIIDKIIYNEMTYQSIFSFTANGMRWDREWGTRRPHNDEWMDVDDAPSVYRPLLRKAIPYQEEANAWTEETCPSNNNPSWRADVSFRHLPLKTIRT